MISFDDIDGQIPVRILSCDFGNQTQELRPSHQQQQMKTCLLLASMCFTLLKVDIMATPLHKAAGVGDLVRVRALLRQNISPNAVVDGGWTVL